MWYGVGRVQKNPFLFFASTKIVFTEGGKHAFGQAAVVSAPQWIRIDVSQLQKGVDADRGGGSVSGSVWIRVREVPGRD
jgi:hypothetical protein